MTKSLNQLQIGQIAKAKDLNLHNFASDCPIWVILVSFFLRETGAYESVTQLTIYCSTKKLHFFWLQLLKDHKLDFIPFVLQK